MTILACFTKPWRQIPGTYVASAPGIREVVVRGPDPLPEDSVFAVALAGTTLADGTLVCADKSISRRTYGDVLGPTTASPGTDLTDAYGASTTEAWPTHIPLTACVRGHLYRVQSRNLVLTAFDGVDGFVGIREKFGSRYLFTEHHWDTGPPHGTACPLEDLGPLPEGILPAENLGMICQKTGRLLRWVPDQQDPHALGNWIYQDSDEPIPAYESRTVTVNNPTLFDLLDAMKQR